MVLVYFKIKSFLKRKVPGNVMLINFVGGMTQPHKFLHGNSENNSTKCHNIDWSSAYSCIKVHLIANRP